MKMSKFSFPLVIIILTVFGLLTGVGPGYADNHTCESDADCPDGLLCFGSDDHSVKFCNDLLRCETHYDCPQGDFCYYEACLSDPQVPVYHCGKQGCPPGEWCVDPEGDRGTCPEDESYVCEDACDCGPAHACIYIPEVEGKRCVKDIFDPQHEGGIVIFDAEIPIDEPTYCCAEPECLAGRAAYGPTESEFSCYDKYTQSASNHCGGKSCFYSGDCEEGESCQDVYIETTGEDLRPGTFCSSQGGRCFSNATAEAVFGWPPSAILKPCSECGPDDGGMSCEVGWEPGGAYIAQRVIGECGSCPNSTCDDWESYLSCPEDCPDELCGDGSCGKLETPKNCPVDCEPYPVCGDGSCDESEIASCEGDCGCQGSSTLPDYLSFCGDGYCDTNLSSLESCATCPGDCGTICPVALCKNVTVSAGPTCTASASIDNGSYMTDGSQITLSQIPVGLYPEGDTVVTLTATNSLGGSSQCTGTVTVVDSSSPQIDNLSASPSIIWPPNHKFVDVAIGYVVSDNCGGIPACSLSVVSNELVEATGDGETSPDWEVFNSHHIQLRAERDGDGTGRVYTTTVMCVDGSGNKSSHDVMINIPIER